MNTDLLLNFGKDSLKYGGSVLDSWIKNHPGTMMTAGAGVYAANKIDNVLDFLNDASINQKIETSNKLIDLSDSISKSLSNAKETINDVFSRKPTASLHDESEDPNNQILPLTLGGFGGAALVGGMMYNYFKKKKKYNV